MPDEFFTRENHPHKYGYGVLLHSGYHYIDLFMSFMMLNETLFPGFQEEVELFVLPTQPHQLLPMFTNAFYTKFLKTDRFADYFTPQKLDQMRYFGETEVLIMGRFKRGEGVLTNFSLKLLDTTVSKRSWHQLPADTYRSNGRMRQENLICHMGPLCSLYVSNLPSPASNAQREPIEDFSIDILNHTDLIGQSPSMRFKRPDLSRFYPDLLPTESMLAKAATLQTLEFLEGKDGKSHLLSHRSTVQFLDRVYRQIQNTVGAPKKERLRGEKKSINIQ